MVMQEIDFEDFSLVFEDTLNSGVFTAFCGVQSAKWTRTADINTAIIPNCDPGLPGSTKQYVKSREVMFSADGTVDQDSKKRMQAWWDSKEKRNVRMVADIDPAKGGGYSSALATLAQFDETGAEHDTWKFSIALKFDGEPVFTPAT